MSLIVHALLYLGVGLTAAVPSFHIDLDLSPTKRWVKVAKHYKTEMISMHAALHLILEKQLGKADWDSWLELAKFGSEYEAELQGMVDTLHDPNVTVDPEDGQHALRAAVPHCLCRRSLVDTEWHCDAWQEYGLCVSL